MVYASSGSGILKIFNIGIGIVILALASFAFSRSRLILILLGEALNMGLDAGIPDDYDIDLSDFIWTESLEFLLITSSAIGILISVAFLAIRSTNKKASAGIKNVDLAFQGLAALLYIAGGATTFYAAYNTMDQLCGINIPLRQIFGDDLPDFFPNDYIIGKSICNTILFYNEKYAAAFGIF